MSITLYHGDCLEVMKDLSGGSVDLFICDLPYGCLASGFRGSDAERYIEGKPTGTQIKTEGCAWDIKIDLEAFWKEVKRLAKSPNTPVLMFCTTKFGNELINSNPSWFRYDLVWDKGRGVSFLSANKMPMRSHEMVYVFSKSGAYYNRVDIKGDFPQSGPRTRKEDNSTQYGVKRTKEVKDNTGKRCPLSVIHNSTSSTRDGHPTEKPIELYKWLIERYCPPGGTVLDPTAGSFNSCFASYELDRHAIGIEKDEKFYKKASERADKLSETPVETPE